jgi:hypothetical protein
MPLGASPGVGGALTWGGGAGKSALLLRREPIAPYAVDYCTHGKPLPRAQSGECRMLSVGDGETVFYSV